MKTEANISGAVTGTIIAKNTPDLQAVMTVRFLNNNLLTALNPSSGSFKVLVYKK